MRSYLAPRDRRLANRLTTLKLALQILDRKTVLTPLQRAMVNQALEATEDLVADFVHAPASAPTPAPAVPAPTAADLSPTAGRSRRGPRW